MRTNWRSFWTTPVLWRFQSTTGRNLFVKAPNDWRTPKPVGNRERDAAGYMALGLLVLPRLICCAALFCVSARSCTNASEPVFIKLPGWIGSVAFSPDGRLVAASCSDNTARLVKASTGEDVSVLRGHRDYVVAVAFLPDGQD